MLSVIRIHRTSRSIVAHSHSPSNAGHRFILGRPETWLGTVTGPHRSIGKPPPPNKRNSAEPAKRWAANRRDLPIRRRAARGWRHPKRTGDRGWSATRM